MLEIPENDEDMIRFLDSTALEDQPTEILIKLSEKLKNRRDQLYHNEEEEEDVLGGMMSAEGMVPQTAEIPPID